MSKYFSLALIFIYQVLYSTFAQTQLHCDPLTLRNGQLSCASPSNPDFVTNCNEGQEIGTIATYQCNPHFLIHKINSATTTLKNKSVNEIHSLKCGQNGKWIGLAQFNSVVCQEDCGKRLRNPKPLIVNGVPTTMSSWPWHAILFRRVRNEFVYICGGTIISRFSILTAAHCVSSQTGQKLDPDSTVVAVQAISRNFTEIMKNKDSQIFNVSKIYVPDSYDYRKQFQADIAVLELDRNIEYSDYVSAACLPMDFSTDSIALAPGKLADVVGFGADETGELSETLKHGVLEIKSRPECFARLQQILTESQFCSGGPRGQVVTVCNGDSGGGLFHPSVIQEKYNVHGIVSTSDAKSKRGLCENYAVFTRVFSFVFWIRDILELIHSNGDIFIQLDSNSSFPYVQIGTETWRKLFLPISPELKNKVTEFQITYADISPELFLSSLEISRNVRFINLTQVRFQNSLLNRKVFLPHLQSVSMDLVPENFQVTESRQFPSPGFTQDFLDSLVFWEKEIDEDEKLIFTISQKLPKLKTDFILQVNIFKCIQLNHQQGKITMAQVPFSNEILENLLSIEEFKLQYFALSRSPLNIATVIPKCQNLKYLVLDEVILGSLDELTDLIQNCKELLTFVFVSPQSVQGQSIEFRLSDFPKTLRHLALTRSNLIFDANQEVFDQLETFYCNECFTLIDNFDQLASTFPNLREIVISSDYLPENVETFLHRFRRLSKAFLRNRDEKSVKYIRINGTLGLRPSNRHIWGLDEFSHLDYIFNRRNNFWSSEGDFNGLNRLSMAELEAMRSGHYRFNGGRRPQSDETMSPIVNPAEDIFSPISQIIQKNLETFEVFNAEIRMKNIVDSLKYGKSVKYVRLLNVTIVDPAYTWEKAELPHLLEYSLIAAGVPGYSTLEPLAVVRILQGVFPGVVPIKQTSDDFDYRISLLQTKVPKIKIMTFLKCTSVIFDQEEGVFISSVPAYTNDWIKNHNGKPLLKIVSAIGDLDPLVIPQTVQNLNLNYVVAFNDSLGILLRRLVNLNELKLINIRVERSENHKRWKIPQIHLQNFPTSLKSFAVERGRIISHSSVRFDHLEFVYFESCGFDPQFTQNFISIFPNLKKLAIIGKSRDAELILSSALNSSHVQWILTTSKLTKEESVKNLLKTHGIETKSNEKDKLFIVERINGIWTKLDSSESKIKSQMLEMKGLTDLGTSPQCYANTWHKIKKID